MNDRTAQSPLWNTESQVRPSIINLKSVPGDPDPWIMWLTGLGVRWSLPVLVGFHTNRLNLSAFFSLASPTSKVAQASDLSLPNSILRSRSLPSRPSKMFFSTTPHSKVEDVPTLLEKVSLQDATHSPKTGASHISSLGLKDKSFESFLQECKQRKDIGDFFNSPKEEGPPGNRVPSLEKLVQPVGSTSMGQVAHPSSTGQDARK